MWLLHDDYKDLTALSVHQIFQKKGFARLQSLLFYLLHGQSLKT